eukprot:TRINITY_DN3958_c0_g1_i3.p1 TRINITY_DN3958_c0_g1~~TRINITY_DN3958_c0_g1_i3.p1  ORF type:complete len:160 (+),score=54.67 TRINITY_DN3958_c0_g1_i3:391-870(+)
MWTFQEKGLLRAENVTHHLAGSLELNPSTYRVKDVVVYSVDIVEWDGESKRWVPFVADDVQLEFVMLDPYIRTTLKHNGAGRFSTEFQVPDVYGVYQFKIHYNRLGRTVLDLATQVKVRPFAHNEFERFIPAAYPYYASAFSMMAGFFIFGIVFLYNKN